MPRRQLKINIKPTASQLVSQLKFVFSTLLAFSNKCTLTRRATTMAPRATIKAQKAVASTKRVGQQTSQRVVQIGCSKGASTIAYRHEYNSLAHTHVDKNAISPGRYLNSLVFALHANQLQTSTCTISHNNQTMGSSSLFRGPTARFKLH